MSLSSSKTPMYFPTDQEESLSREPSLQGSLNHLDIADFLSGVPSLKATGWIEFTPSGIALQFLEGDLIAAKGIEPLGTILLRQNAISEIKLAEALRSANKHSLGDVLTSNPAFGISREVLLTAMRTQIVMAVNTLIIGKQSYFKYFRSDKIPRIYTRIGLQWALLESVAFADEMGASELGLSTVLRARPDSSLSGVSISGDEWQLLTSLNGRRNLHAALRLFAAGAVEGNSVWLRGYRAALRLYRQGLLELAAVMGLRTIVLQRVRTLNASYHPPAGMVANLFIKMLDGQKNAFEIGIKLNLEPDKIAQIVVALYRDQVAEVVLGTSELERLLDEY